MSYAVTIKRLNDGFTMTTGFGSYAGCKSEAAGLRRKMRSRGERFRETQEGEWWQSQRVLVSIIHSATVPDRIEWDPAEFTSKKLETP